MTTWIRAILQDFSRSRTAALRVLSQNNEALVLIAGDFKRLGVWSLLKLWKRQSLQREAENTLLDLTYEDVCIIYIYRYVFRFNMLMCTNIYILIHQYTHVYVYYIPDQIQNQVVCVGLVYSK